MLNFFVDVGKNTDKDIPCGNCCLTSFLKGNFPDSMFLSPVTSVEVDSYISQMDNNKSIGPYSIPVTSLKILKTHIFPLISSLINELHAVAKWMKSNRPALSILRTNFVLFYS